MSGLRLAVWFLEGCRKLSSARIVFAVCVSVLGMGSGLGWSSGTSASVPNEVAQKFAAQRKLGGTKQEYLRTC